MKIVLAAGIYPPDIGGPARYAQELRAALIARGHAVDLVLFGPYKKFPAGVRHVLYTFELFLRALRSDAVIALDSFSVAAPAAVVAAITGKKTVVRIGGDFIWERHIEKTGDLIPLPVWYERLHGWSFSERVLHTVLKTLLRHVEIVFSAPWLRDIWVRQYHLDTARVHVIENAIERKLDPLPPARKNILLFARQIQLKNAIAFRQAIEKAQKNSAGVELDEGTVAHDALLESIRSCYAVAIPSISEVSPNLVIESIRCGKPFILTKYSGYAERFKEYGVLVDPLSVEAMAEGIERLARDEVYRSLTEKIREFNEFRPYTQVAAEFETLFL